MNGLKNLGPLGSFSLLLFGDPALSVSYLFRARMLTVLHSTWSVEERSGREGKPGYLEGHSSCPVRKTVNLGPFLRPEV